jgi:uncharacterized lipoprotein YajG
LPFMTSGLITLIAALTLIAGCHNGKTPQPTAQNIADVEQEAARELAQARVEASKDIKSAAKVAGSNSRELDRAKVTASYDIAMAKADGNHKIAIEKCLTLPVSTTQACKEQADADYDTAKAAAKVTRIAREQ